MNEKKILMPEPKARTKRVERTRSGRTSGKPARPPAANSSSSISPSQRNEAIGLILIGTSIFLIALFHNMIPLQLAGFLTSLTVNFGFGIYLVPAIVGLMGLQRFFERPFSNLTFRLLGSLGIVVFGLGLLGLEGGKIGATTFGFFSGYFGVMPTRLLFLFFTLASLIFALDILYKDLIIASIIIIRSTISALKSCWNFSVKIIINMITISKITFNAAYMLWTYVKKFFEENIDPPELEAETAYGLKMLTYNQFHTSQDEQPLFKEVNNKSGSLFDNIPAPVSWRDIISGEYTPLESADKVQQAQIQTPGLNSAEKADEKASYAPEKAFVSAHIHVANISGEVMITNVPPLPSYSGSPAAAQFGQPNPSVQAPQASQSPQASQHNPKLPERMPFTVHVRPDNTIHPSLQNSPVQSDFSTAPYSQNQNLNQSAAQIQQQSHAQYQDQQQDQHLTLNLNHDQTQAQASASAQCQGHLQAHASTKNSSQNIVQSQDQTVAMPNSQTSSQASSQTSSKSPLQSSQSKTQNDFPDESLDESSDTSCSESDDEIEDSDSPVLLEDNLIDKDIKTHNSAGSQPVEPAAASESGVESTLPPIDLLIVPPPKECEAPSDLAERSALLLKTLDEFGIKAQITAVVEGPAVSRFELKPAPGIKVARFTSLIDDIALALSAPAIRIEAPIPGKPALGIEIPNSKPKPVYFYDLIKNEKFLSSETILNLALGVTINGRPVFADLADMPHLLIAGSTGSGKSVCINTIIASILYQAHPDQVKMVMIDPKMVELSSYNGIPHLISPVVTDPKKASSALLWAVEEMERRYELLASCGMRKISSYNQELPRLKTEIDSGLSAMPYMVIIIDELADLMMTASAEVEGSICRLAQMARAVGIHLVIATQRPSVDVLTGTIKANLPSRIAFSVASHIDSRTILDTKGAEKLLGKGDMLFVPKGRNKPLRLQGAFISDQELMSIADWVKEHGQPEYIDIAPCNSSGSEGSRFSESDDEDSDDNRLIAEILRWLATQEKTSTSMLQRKFKIGYNRAARIMDKFEEDGLVGPSDGSNKRKILAKRSGIEQ
ncbi:MAG: hypothetical protein HQM10_18625 [Candidatus Riflebacteria bacterium]|nr:hypothetical protein [Candidatus Riflebacteria bacterium]